MLILVGGENVYESINRLKEIFREFKSSYENGVIKVFNADEINDRNEILTSADSLSLFSQNTLFVIKRALQTNNEFQEKLATYIENVKNPYIVFWEDTKLDRRRRLYKIIDKIGVVEEFSLYYYTKLKSWLTKILSSKVDFEPECINELLIKIGQDQMVLKKTVSNLIFLLKAEGRNKLLISDINKFVVKTVDESIWKFLDYLSDKNRKEALKIAENLIREKQDFSIVIAMIARQLRILTLVKFLSYYGKSQAEITRTLKLHPFVTRRVLDYSKKYTISSLRTLYQKLVNTDFVVKTGKFDEKLAIDLFIAAI